MLLTHAFTGTLTANPIEFITHWTGDWTLRFLLITLAITPVRQITGLHSVIRFRRMLGLFAFFYGSLHLLTYVALDYFFAFGLMLENIVQNLFIIAGLVGFVLMIPLAVTSSQAMIRRLGGRRWRILHRLVYVSAIAGVVHYSSMSKIDIRRPLAYGAILTALLAFRLLRRQTN
jgi:sulfoxide reductase heme-binding subunit YedZ